MHPHRLPIIANENEKNEMNEKFKAMEQSKGNTKHVVLELFKFTTVGEDRFYKEHADQLKKLWTTLSNAGVSINTAEVVATPVHAEEEEEPHDGDDGDGARVNSGVELQAVEIQEQHLFLKTTRISLCTFG